MKQVFFALFIFSTLGLKPQTPTVWTEDSLTNTVLLIGQPQKDHPELTTIGTATLINYLSKYYLLTAAHVAKDIYNNQAFVCFKDINDKPLNMMLSDLTQTMATFSKDAQIFKWVIHPEADIAMIQVFPRSEADFNRFIKYSFPAVQIHDKAANVNRNFTITTLGYSIIDVKNFKSLIFNSPIASELLIQNRIDTNTPSTFFLLQNPSMQGLSGGPVLIGAANNSMTFGPPGTFIIGVVHGTRGDNTGGKLAMITPSFYIWDLLKKFRLSPN